ncbi:acyl carrier protein [Arboricoccus pini]|uniref:Acyl carrier protein n=1 Tax=Arboricoccus pini TaxID=1963835 RepID=A0A212R407_9PROT|nr:phosphopantetheine-binding protein [Arboricoccus pini]SNB66744.1 acyl carrier protein [Arboricoccus pini]
MTSLESGNAMPATDPALERQLARLIVDTLHLEIEPESISPLDPLFRDGLGLDSIDALEIALAVSQSFGMHLKSDDEQNHQIFANLRSLAAHIAQHRTK